MAQRLREIVDLSDNPLIPNTISGPAITTYNSSSKRPKTFLGSSSILHISCTHRNKLAHTFQCVYTCTYK